MKLKTKLSKLRHDGHITDAEYTIIINALNKSTTQPPKTQPCEDCISRQEAIKEFQIYREYSSNRSNADWVDRIETVLMHLPPVTPQAKPCEDAIGMDAVIEWLKNKDIIKLSSQEEIARKELKELLSVTPQDQQPCETSRTNLAKTSQDCISRDEAIRVAEQGQIQGYEWQFKKLCNLPPVTPQPKTGKWIRSWCEWQQYLECSKCGYETGLGCDTNYCPNCGCRMKGEDE